jgi:hypothetical protein
VSRYSTRFIVLLIFRYEPGDVAIIHPYASDEEVFAFLSTMHWEDFADEPLSIEQSMYGACTCLIR